MNTFRQILACGAVLVVALSANAAGDYVTKNASGTTSATVYFNAEPLKQVRLVGAIATSDKAASVLSIRAGTSSYVIISNNATTTATDHFLTFTNGLAANDVLMLQRADGTAASGIVSAVVTNKVTLTSGGFGSAVAAGDQIYKLSAATTIKVGAATAVYQGEALYAGTRGRPIRVVLDGTSACSLDSVTARYD
jgi:hypothetical protein